MPVSQARQEVMSDIIKQMLTVFPITKEAIVDPAFKIRNLWLDFLALTHRTVINRRLPHDTGTLRFQRF
jgi:hypothetical protein